MKTLPLLLLALAAAPTAAAPPKRVLVVDIVVDGIDMGGKTVRVAGRLGECRPTVCSLSDGRGRNVATIGLGDSPGFDRAVRGLTGRRILVEGVVNARGFERIGTADDGGMTISWQKAKPGHRVGQLDRPRLISILSRR